MKQASSPPWFSVRLHLPFPKRIARAAAVVAGCVLLMKQLAAGQAPPALSDARDIESREKIVIQTLRKARQELEDTRRKIPDAENSALAIQKALPLLPKGDPAQLNVIFFEFNVLPRNRMPN